MLTVLTHSDKAAMRLIIWPAVTNKLECTKCVQTPLSHFLSHLTFIGYRIDKYFPSIFVFSFRRGKGLESYAAPGAEKIEMFDAPCNPGNILGF